MKEPELPTTPSRSPKPSQNQLTLSQTQVFDLPAPGPWVTRLNDDEESPLAAGSTHTRSIGDVLAARYEILRLLGSGGMGSVYAAHDRVRGEEVAVKVLAPWLVNDARARQWLLDEGKLASNLSHPHIVRVYDVHCDDSEYFVSMELLPGRNLREEMHVRNQQHMRFTICEVRELVAQLCSALQYAHQSMIHRDIKPENIWCAPGNVYKLMDFGVALPLNIKMSSSKREGIGTAYYIAPEQLRCGDSPSAPVDQYALAVVAYELLVGELPQGHFKAPHETRRSIPLAASEALMRALSAQPEDRFPTMEAFGEAFSKGSSPIRAHPLLVGSAVCLVLAALLLSIPWRTVAPTAHEWISGRSAAIKQAARHAADQAVAQIALLEQSIVGWRCEEDRHLDDAKECLGRAQQFFDCYDDANARDAYDEAGKLARDGLESVKQLNDSRAETIGQLAAHVKRIRIDLEELKNVASREGLPHGLALPTGATSGSAGPDSRTRDLSFRIASENKSRILREKLEALSAAFERLLGFTTELSSSRVLPTSEAPQGVRCSELLRLQLNYAEPILAYYQFAIEQWSAVVPRREAPSATAAGRRNECQTLGSLIEAAFASRNAGQELQAADAFTDAARMAGSCHDDVAQYVMQFLDEYVSSISPVHESTVLHQWVESADLDSIRAIYEAGFSLDVPDKDLRTPLHRLCNSRAHREQDVAIAEMLLAFGADPRVVDRYGRNALHMACMSDHLGMVKLLLKERGRATKLINSADKDKQCPGDLAMGKSSGAIKELLYASGWDKKGGIEKGKARSERP